MMRPNTILAQPDCKAVSLGSATPLATEAVQSLPERMAGTHRQNAIELTLETAIAALGPTAIDQNA